MKEELQSTQEVSNNTNPTTPQTTESAPAQEPQEQVGKRYDGDIIVNGVNVMQYSARDIPKELLDKLTEEQLKDFIIGFTEEDKKYVRAQYGYVESHLMTPEEIEKRKERRMRIISTLSIRSGANSARTTTSQKPNSNEPMQTKEEQTGSVIFGKRD